MPHNRLVVLTMICLSQIASAETDESLAYVRDIDSILGEELIHNASQTAPATSQHEYKISIESSEIGFRVDTPLGEIDGIFGDFSGDFSFDGRNEHETASIKVDTDSISTSANFIANLLRGEGFFDVEKYPTIKFTGEEMYWLDEDRAIITGWLSIKNVSRQTSFYMTIDERHEDSLTLSATTNIKRSAYNIHALLPIVSDDVTLEIRIDARQSISSETAITMAE